MSAYPFIAFDDVSFCPKCNNDELVVIDVEIDSMRHSSGVVLESMSRELHCTRCGVNIHQILPMTPTMDLEPQINSSPARFGT